LSKPFTVVLPVHVIRNCSDLAHTCWMGLKVMPDPNDTSERRLSKLRQPEEGNWRVLTEAYRFTQDFDETIPVVVRLAGCPLIDLPVLTEGSQLKRALAKTIRVQLADETRENPEDIAAGMGNVLEGLQLQHAVVLNEHDAMLHSQLDLISFAPDGLTKDDASASRGLPVWLADDSAFFWRYWVMLGVQVDDSAVRHRLATVISSAWNRGNFIVTQGSQPPLVGAPTGQGLAPPSASPPNGGRRGVAINRYSTQLAQDLLFWNGFDVVEHNTGDFKGQLEHYRCHLEKNEPCNRADGYVCRL
jgi:hypothetical protein